MPLRGETLNEKGTDWQFRGLNPLGMGTNCTARHARPRWRDTRDAVSRHDGIAESRAERHLPADDSHISSAAMNETPLEKPTRRSLLFRVALIPVVAIVNFAINMFGIAMTRLRVPNQPPPELLHLFLIGAGSAVAWVALSVPVQFATRRLVRTRLSTAVLAHFVVATGFLIAHSTLSISLRTAVGHHRPGFPFLEQIERHIVGMLPLNLLIYVALVAGTLAWDNWRLSVRRERTAEHLAAELTRAELAALRSKIQPHFLFNALHGISSVMDTDVVTARRMMAALSHLLRSSLSANGESLISLEQELQFTRDYLELQHMRFEDRLLYDLEIDARPSVRVPSFILQPLVENAVVHGMAERPEPTKVRVAVRELANEVEIDVSDDGPGFPQGILDGTKPLGVGLGALRARLLAMPTGPGTMTLRNRPGGGAQVIVRVGTDDEDKANA
jgi:signal transduction histidine kinase